MDGASKFVRGDAIAGLLIVAINIVGGIIIGVAQQGLSFSEAGRTYTLLTVGDGLVTQIPALIVSTAAGHVIEAFGNFVMGGNFVIGIIVFAILVIVNFVVITKGSGRIAEVAARFHLDAMPGKQMAIDADLGAGLID